MESFELQRLVNSKEERVFSIHGTGIPWTLQTYRIGLPWILHAYGTGVLWILQNLFNVQENTSSVMSSVFWLFRQTINYLYLESEFYIISNCKHHLKENCLPTSKSIYLILVSPPLPIKFLTYNKYNFMESELQQIN